MAKKAETRTLAFEVGQSVVYPAHGVGKITAVEKQTVAGMALEVFASGLASGFGSGVPSGLGSDFGSGGVSTVTGSAIGGRSAGRGRGCRPRRP